MKEDWQKLANGNADLRFAMGALYDLFQKAPVLGSLINVLVVWVLVLLA